MIRRISWSANRPTAGPFTGKRAVPEECSARTLIISKGMMVRPQGELAASAYQGEVSVMTFSLSFRLKG